MMLVHGWRVERDTSGLLNFDGCGSLLPSCLRFSSRRETRYKGWKRASSNVSMDLFQVVRRNALHVGCREIRNTAAVDNQYNKWEEELHAY